MAKLKKKYRLVRPTGWTRPVTFRHPNPNFRQDESDPEESHVAAQEGDVVELNDDQFKAFKDRFRPIESEASEVRDLDSEELREAQMEAMRTGQTVNPNAPRSAGSAPGSPSVDLQ